MLHVLYKIIVELTSENFDRWEKKCFFFFSSQRTTHVPWQADENPRILESEPTNKMAVKLSFEKFHRGETHVCPG